MYHTHIMWKELYVQRSRQQDVQVHTYRHIYKIQREMDMDWGLGIRAFPSPRPMPYALCPLSWSHTYATQAAHFVLNYLKACRTKNMCFCPLAFAKNRTVLNMIILRSADAGSLALT